MQVLIPLAPTSNPPIAILSYWVIGSEFSPKGFIGTNVGNVIIVVICSNITNYLNFDYMAKGKKEKQPTPMEKLTEGYEDFIKGKEVKEGGKDAFEKVIKKAVTKPKQHGLK